MENRYKLPKGLQRKYLLKLEKVSHLQNDELAKLFEIVPRSYRDWKRGKFSISEKAVNIVEDRWKLKLPYSKRIALEEWKKNIIEKARIGGLVVSHRYGGPGTPEGRSKGGKIAIKILREKGLIPQPKPFIFPQNYSVKLAELVGILLGDGHIGKEQWSVSLNAKKDYKYSKFVINLISKNQIFNSLLIRSTLLCLSYFVYLC